MTAEGHILFALSSVILIKKVEIISFLLQEDDYWHIITGSLLSALLPDIDHPKSFIGQRLKHISTFIAKTFGHRGFTHSLFIVFLSIVIFKMSFSSINTIIPLDVFHGIVIGYLSHIIADMFTPYGVQLFWPYRIRLHIFSISNKKMERFICVILLFFALFYSEYISFLKEIVHIVSIYYKEI
ncbi:metal-dependent hydrolase [Candidatus Schneideria nysicola]|uniref:metal-dependent hydrolase n=1 Tax=Candidatus Schneideria nysicola TaxID=1081631 RepID=UPI001CAA5D42|nr:metal-dependent hydrolase [Candidatus Schneideria nysicola]UAJ64870.1 metal-dependent hydrolase [Candidatus Schneideria nysicola]